MNANQPIHRKLKIRSLHHRLVNQMKSNGLFSTRSIEAAFRAVPRHLFLPDMALEEVYRDQAIPTKSLQERIVSSSSQPTMMAIMLHQLQLQPGQRVLEIGAGTGYNAALIAHIVGRHGQVITIDIDEDIVESARTHLQAAGYGHVQVFCADGFSGYPDAAPYDRIILTVSAADIAPAWREQLKQDGRLLLPLSLRGSQISAAFAPTDDHLASVSVRHCRFVGLRGALTEEPRVIELPSTSIPHTLIVYEPCPVEAATIGEWLTAAYEDLSTSVRVLPQAIQYGLGLWLATYEPGFCILTAQGSEASRSVIPMLLHSSSNVAQSLTGGLLNERSLCLLMQDTTQPPTGASGESPFFTLKIRSFGTDPQHTLAHRLRARIESWQRAARPDATRLHIKAYPSNAHYLAAEQEQIVSRQWTQFVITYDSAAGKAQPSPLP